MLYAYAALAGVAAGACFWMLYRDRWGAAVAGALVAVAAGVW